MRIICAAWLRGICICAVWLCGICIRAVRLRGIRICAARLCNIYIGIIRLCGIRIGAARLRNICIGIIWLCGIRICAVWLCGICIRIIRFDIVCLPFTRMTGIRVLCLRILLRILKRPLTVFPCPVLSVFYLLRAVIAHSGQNPLSGSRAVFFIQLTAPLFQIIFIGRHWHIDSDIFIHIFTENFLSK